MQMFGVTPESQTLSIIFLLVKETLEKRWLSSDVCYQRFPAFSSVRETENTSRLLGYQ